MTTISKMNTKNSNNVNLPRFTYPASFSNFLSFRFFYLTLILGAIFTESVKGQSFNSNRQGRVCVCDDLNDGGYNANTDYFPHKVTNNFNDLWTVSYHKSYKKLQVLVNETTGEKSTFYLYQCGTPVPGKNQGVQSGDHVIEIPIRAVMTDSTTHTPLFEQLSQRDSITVQNNGYFSEVEACMQKLIEDNRIKLQSDVVNDDEYDVYFSSPGKKDEKFNKPTVPIRSDLLPADEYLGLYEWIEVVSLFFNREQSSIQVFEKTYNGYQCRLDKVKNKLKTASRPGVLTMQFLDDYSGTFSPEKCTNKTWFDLQEVVVYGCDSEYNSTRCAALENAGAEYVQLDYSGIGFSPYGSAARKMNHSTFVKIITPKMNNIDYIYYFGLPKAYPMNCENEKFALIENVKAVKEKKVYSVDKTTDNNSALTYFGGKEADPNLYMEDLISIFHPDLEPDHERYFFLDYFNNESRVIITSDDCDDVEKPLYRNWSKIACEENNEFSPAPEGLDTVDNNNVCYYSFSSSEVPDPSFPASSSPILSPTPSPTPSPSFASKKMNYNILTICTFVIAIMF